MTYRGTIKNGAVVLDQPVQLPEDTKVDVVIVQESELSSLTPGQNETFYERYKAFFGAAEGLPPDMAKNHDHYLHGLPKKD